MTEPFTARRMMLAGPLAAEVAGLLTAAAPDLQSRLKAPGPLPDDDVAWADSYAGFRLPANLATPARLAAAPLRWVHSMAAGVDGLVPAFRDPTAGGHLERELPVLTRTIGGMPRAIGTYVLAHVLDHVLDLARYRDLQRRREWHQLRVRRLADARAVVVGTGEIGTGVADVLRANGVRVTGASASGRPRPSFPDVVALGGRGTVSEAARAVLGDSDVVVLALPLTDATRDLVGGAVLGALDGALVVNVGRGATLVPEDLRSALADGRVARAILDVHEAEPLPPEDWRWTHERVTVTPHVSGPSSPADVVEAILAARASLAAGERPPHAVDLARGY